MSYRRSSLDLRSLQAFCLLQYRPSTFTAGLAASPNFCLDYGNSCIDKTTQIIQWLLCKVRVSAQHFQLIESHRGLRVKLLILDLHLSFLAAQVLWNTEHLRNLKLWHLEVLRVLKWLQTNVAPCCHVIQGKTNLVVVDVGGFMTLPQSHTTGLAKRDSSVAFIC